MKGHLLLLEEQLRVEGRAWGGGVVGSLPGHVVLHRGQRLEHDRWDLRGEVVLHLPLQLHASVLEPGPHLREDNIKLASRATQNQRVCKCY